MSLVNDRAAIAAALGATGIARIYASEPDSIEPPCLVVGNPTGTYSDTFEGLYSTTWPVVLLVSRAADSQHAIAAIDPYIETSGASSVVAALVGVPRAKVVGWSNYGAGYTVADTEYAGVTFEVQVLSL